MKRCLFLLFIFSITVLPSYADITTYDAQLAVESLDTIVDQSQNTPTDLIGVTLEGTLEGALSNGLMSAAAYYGLGAVFNRTSPELNAINAELKLYRYLKSIAPLTDVQQKRFKELLHERDIEHGNIILDACEPTTLNAQILGALFAQYVGGTIAYGALRAATKEVTGYDAAPIVQDSTISIAAQTIGSYIAPASYNVNLFSKNQIASYVATDLTVAASMYAYKEMTGKKLTCPELPAALRPYISEQNVGTAVYAASKFALRTFVMDKLCGVQA